MRQKRVVVAVVRDEAGRFLVHFNPKWLGYTFPMRDLEPHEDPLASVAVAALEDDLDCRLPNARATELEYLTHTGISGSTGELTEYQCWLYAVDPGRPLDLAAVPTWNENPPMFLTFAELTSRPGLTWSAVSLVRDFVENQEAVLALVTRPGDNGTEFLMLWNDNYGGYFFPTQRIKTEAKPDRAAIATLRNDIGYTGAATATRVGEEIDVHFSTRFHSDRSYRFHLCEVELTDIDLYRPFNPLERALARRNHRYLWVPTASLAESSIPFSQTLDPVRAAVIAAIPVRTIPKPVRTSEGGLAAIRREVGGRSEWLAQWNDNSKAFFLVGGHREEGETFRDCVVREIGEELGLTEADCAVEAAPAARVRYRAVSLSAGVLTQYESGLFRAEPSADGLRKVAADTRNRWLKESEIRGLETDDGRRVSDDVLIVLHLAGMLS